MQASDRKVPVAIADEVGAGGVLMERMTCSNEPPHRTKVPARFDSISP